MIKPNYILLSAMMLTLAACGGSSTSSITPDPDPSPTVSGTVADGYLAGATVCLDINNNKKCELDEPQAISDSNGEFTIEATQEQVDGASIVAIVTDTTVDSDTGLPVPNAYVLSAPAGETFVSPISTIVHHLLETNPEFDLDEAVGEAHEILGVAEVVDLLDDYIEGGETDLHETAQNIAAVLGIEIEDAEGIVENSDQLDEDDFRNVFAVVVDQIIDHADAIVDADLVTIDGSIIDLADNEFEDEVERQELDHNLELVSVEDFVTSPFHRIGEDNDCDSVPGPQLSLSEGCLFDSEFPTIVRETIQVDAASGAVNQTKFVYNFSAKEWESAESETHTDIVLGDQGWAVSDEGNEVVSFNSDGTATISSNGAPQEIISIALVDLSGLPLSLIVNDDNDEDTSQDLANGDGHDSYFDELFDTAAEGIVFAPGSTGIRFSFESLADRYEIFDHGGGFCEDFNGNCNVIHIGPGDPIASLDSESLYVSADSSVGSFGPSIYLERGYIQLVEGATEISTSGVARLVSLQSGGEINPEASCAELPDCFEATWMKQTVNGEEILKIDIPADLRETFVGKENDGTAVILAEQNGYVRRGSFQPSGSSKVEEDLMFNDTALDAADALLEAVADLLIDEERF